MLDVVVANAAQDELLATSVNYIVDDQLYPHGIIRWNQSHIKYAPYPYYVLPTEGLDPIWYKELKRTYPDVSFFPPSPVQLGHRWTLPIDPSLSFGSVDTFLSKHPAWQRAVWWFLGQTFKDFVDTIFPDELKRQFGYKGHDTWHVRFDVSIAGDGYWSPVHVDLRSRIAVLLLYFGKDDVGSGGEVCMVEHKPLDDWTHHKQFPNLDDVTNKICWPPQDNAIMLFLNTPNSYHWAAPNNGTRRFIFISLTAEHFDPKPGDINANTWQCGHVLDKFQNGVKLQGKQGLFQWTGNSTALAHGKEVYP